MALLQRQVETCLKQELRRQRLDERCGSQPKRRGRGTRPREWDRQRADRCLYLNISSPSTGPLAMKRKINEKSYGIMMNHDESCNKPQVNAGMMPLGPKDQRWKACWTQVVFTTRFPRHAEQSRLPPERDACPGHVSAFFGGHERHEH